MAITEREVNSLRHYLEGTNPGSDGEWGMHCPFHDDKTRSASVNVNKRKWWCIVCQEGGDLTDLVYRIGMDRESTSGSASGGEESGFETGGDEDFFFEESERSTISEGSVQGFVSSLFSDPQALNAIVDYRGISVETLSTFQVGWDREYQAYTIPIRSETGEVVNIRRYKINPGVDREGAPRRKIWSVKGHGKPDLYPIHMLDDSDTIVICEGEWDAMLTIQNGFSAVTRTASAETWNRRWNELFRDKVVIICHDMDTAGQKANRKVHDSLKNYAREIKVVMLPYEVLPKHGKDLSNFWNDGYSPQDFKDLIGAAETTEREPEVVEGEFVDLSVMDSFDASGAGKRIRMRVTITGKRNPSYLIPHIVQYTCSQDAGAKCNICPMNSLGGNARRPVSSHDPAILEMMGATNKQVEDTLRGIMGIPKCPVLTMEVVEHRAVEELFVRPSIDRFSSEQGDYTNRKIVSVGRHDSLPNNTVEVVGTIFPSPRGQYNEFQAWDVSKTETSIDRYQITEDGVKMMKVFQSNGKGPLVKVAEVAKDISLHVTKIYGRPEMHALMDLVFHSVMGFEFGGTMQDRGWMDALIVGDTRTGKSEVAQKLIHHYRMGEMISCESATYAGIVGGLQQYGSRGEWEITWGAIPLNDRRLVVLDEVSGMTHEQIAQMSSIRSSGEAQLTKIRSERTLARTRLIWLGNPRNGRMTDYTYGVQSIRPLIGNNEDIARFDIAMSVAASDIDSKTINMQHQDPGPQRFSPEACRELLLWVWSRKPEQVIWLDGAQTCVYDAAVRMGQKYVETVPLIQSANARIKIARISAAIAARTFSTDDGYECVVIRPEHVRAAVQFIDKIYSMKGFGYKEQSEEAIQDSKDALAMRDEAKAYLVQNRGLAKFLRSMGRFRSNDLQDMMNFSREEANKIIGTLWKYRMITREGPSIKVQPVLHELLREVKE